MIGFGWVTACEYLGEPVNHRSNMFQTEDKTTGD